MYTGIGTASDIYFTTLPPLTSTQKQYIQRVVEKNQPLFNLIQSNNITSQLQTIWDNTANTSTTEILQKANFSSETDQINQVMLKVQSMVPQMRIHRIAANQSIDEQLTEIRAKAEGTSIQTDVENILNQLLK